MAGRICTATLTSSLALTSSTPRTIQALYAPANQKVVIHGITVSLDGSSTGVAPCVVEIVNISTDGTYTTGTPRLFQDASGTIQTVYRYAYTVEPTVDSVLWTVMIPVYNGALDKYFPLGMEPVVNPGDLLGLRLTAPTSVNALASILFAE